MDIHSDTGLAYAAHLGKLRMAQVLVKNGADVNQKGNLERAPLTIAVACPLATRQKICRLLLDRGADVNAADCDGNTPLMIAVRFKRFDLARHLVERGANPKLRNRDWKRAVDLIGHGKGSKALKKLLKQVS
ncbi:MAG: ankyrin repeat domain-containing protein [Desulfomonilaceae bacterium]